MGIIAAITELFRFGKKVGDVVDDKVKQSGQPVQLAESQKEKSDAKKQDISEAVEPGKSVEEIRKQTRYPGP